ncbi:MAG: AraC family transcriptional regulator [Clostridiaceae bacterium]
MWYENDVKAESRIHCRRASSKIYRRKQLLCLSIPVVCSLFIVAFLYMKLSNEMEKNYEYEASSFNTGYLNQIVDDMESNLKLVLNNVAYLLYNDAYFYDFLMQDNLRSAIGVYMPDVEYLNYQSFFYKSLLNIKRSNSFIESTYIYNRSSGKIYTTDYTANQLDNLKDNELYYVFCDISSTEDILRNDNIWYLYRDSAKGKMMTIIFNSRDVYCIVDMNLQKMINYENKSMTSKYQSQLFILNADNRVIAENLPNNIGIKRQDMEGYLKNTGNLSLQEHFNISTDQGKMTAASRISQVFMLKFVNVISDRGLRTKQNMLMTTLILSYAVIMIISFLLFMLILKYLYRPFINLANELKSKFFLESKDDRQYDVSAIQDNINQLFTENSLLSKKLNATMPVSREKFLHNLLSINADTPEMLENISAQMEYYGCRFPPDMYHVAVIEINTVRNLAEKYSVNDIMLFRKSITGIIDQFLDEGLKGFAVEDQEDKVVLAYHAAREEEQQFLKVLNDIVDQISKVIGISVSVGTGGFAVNLLSVGRSMDEALQTLKYKISHERNEIISFNTIEVKTGLIGSAYMKNRDKLLNYLKIADREKSNNILDSMMDFIAINKKHISYKESIEACICMLNDINSLLSVMGGNSREILNLSNGIYSELILKFTRNDIDELYRELIFRSANFFASKIVTIDNKSRIVTEVCKYIEENYGRDFSLEEIADNVNLNPVYLSKIFKEIKGINFSSFVEKTRMDNAIQMLMSTDLKINKVSAEVGYRNCNYFARVFKRYTGLTPEIYRDRLYSQSVR